MSSIGLRMQSQWIAAGTRVRPGVSEEAVEFFEGKYGTSLPQDLKEFYSIVDGMEDSETDDRLVRFLPLESVKPVTEELAQLGGIPDYRGVTDTLPNATSFFVFAEYMIRSHVYAIRLSSDLSTPEPIVLICGSHWRVVASSFSEFIEKYVEKRDELLIA